MTAPSSSTQAGLLNPAEVEVLSRVARADGGMRGRANPIKQISHCPRFDPELPIDAVDDVYAAVCRSERVVRRAANSGGRGSERAPWPDPRRFLK
jgi:hypothetical protein